MQVKSNASIKPKISKQKIAKQKIEQGKKLRRRSDLIKQEVENKSM
jgi:hypothetical protein